MGFRIMELSRIIALVATALVSFASAGHTAEKSKLTVGLVAVAGSSIYLNGKSRSALMPSISYKTETVTISFEKGLSYKFFDDGKATVSGAVAPRLRPYRSSYSADLSGMKRTNFYDGKLNASYKISRVLTTRFEIATELTNKFNGTAANLSLSQFIPVWRQPFILTAGVKWYDSNRSNYFYGVNSNEVSGARTQYSPGSSTLPYIAINTFYPLTKRTNLFANVNVNFLPNNVVNSPIVTKKSSASLLLGLNYQF